MRSSTVVRIFCILILIYCMKMIDIVKGMNVKEVQDDIDSTVVKDATEPLTFDIDSGNSKLVAPISEVATAVEAPTSEIDPENLRSTLLPDSDIEKELATAVPNKEPEISKPSLHLSVDDGKQSIEEISKSDSPDTKAFSLKQILAQHPQELAKKNNILNTKENVQNQLVKVSSGPKMNFEILSKLLTSLKNGENLKPFLPNAGHSMYSFNPMKAIEYRKHKSNELPVAVTSTKIETSQPSQQLQADDDDPTIEQISTSELPDEKTFFLQNLFNKLAKEFLKNSGQPIGSGDFSPKEIQSKLLSINSDKNIPSTDENVQNQLVKVSSGPKMNFEILSKLLTSLKNGENLKPSLPNADHSTYSFNPMRAIEYREHKSNEPASSSHIATENLDKVVAIYNPPVSKSLSSTREPSPSMNLDQANVDSGIELPVAVTSTKIETSQPSQQLQADDDDPTIEQISTSELPDEKTFFLQNLFKKLAKEFSKNSGQPTGPGDFSQKEIKSNLLLINSDKNIPSTKENVQNQLVKVSSGPKMNFEILSKLLTSLKNGENLKPSLPNADHSTYSFNPMKAIEYQGHQSNEPPASLHVVPEDSKKVVAIYNPPVPTSLSAKHEAPPSVNLDQENVQSEKGVSEKFKQTVQNDIKDIEDLFYQFEPLSNTRIFSGHRERAKAFVTCCQMKKNPNDKLLKDYVDAYDSIKEQDSIINECRTILVSPNPKHCEIALSKLAEVAAEDMKFVRQHIDFDQKQQSLEMLDWLNKVPDQNFQVKNIVYDYHIVTQNSCDPPIVLLWQPAKLVQCETIYRLLLLTKQTAPEDYNKFNKEISEPFREKAINLMNSVKDAWDNMVNLMHSSIQMQSTNKSTSEVQINDEMDSLMTDWAVYKPYLQHPMIAHQAKRAHVYKVCCGPIETTNMFNQYLANYDLDSKQGYAMNKLLSDCVHQQVPHPIDAMTDDNECSAAYNDLTDAMGQRQNFINKYGKRNPTMIQHLKQAIKLKKHQASILQNMATYSRKYCPDQHIFELMFDYNKNMQCEKLIRLGVGKESSLNYTLYSATISQPFQDLVQGDWDGISEVLTNLNAVDDTANTAHIHDMRPAVAQHQSMNLLGNGAPMVTVLHQYISVCFMLLIQILFFQQFF